MPHRNKTQATFATASSIFTLYIVHFLLKRHRCWKYQPIIFTTSAAVAACSLRHLILIKCLWCGVVKTEGCDPLPSIQPFISGRCLAKNSRQKDVGLLASENGLPEVQLFFAFFFWGVEGAILRCEGNYMSDGSACCKTSGLSDHEIREGARGANCSLPSVGGESRESELSTNSMNTGALTDQWPVTQYWGSSRVEGSVTLT